MSQASELLSRLNEFSDVQSFDNKKDWAAAADKANSAKDDDNSEITSDSSGSWYVESKKGVTYAFWDEKKSKGWVSPSLKAVQAPKVPGG